MSILKRIEFIRTNEGITKAKFESEVLSKSVGYLKSLEKNESLPGSDVLLKIYEKFPGKYNLEWIITGMGEALHGESFSKGEGVAFDMGVIRHISKNVEAFRSYPEWIKLLDIFAYGDSADSIREEINSIKKKLANLDKSKSV